ncbi:class II fructose-1,6-bisphosphate aldolase [Mycoplasmopsis opalescens]|uniref:class II fructose-1,6-bisphosphate aldolase n=1 Tax=Mycoplasmopsis opalescens TaxID=114886 RepID=UPI0004A6DA79|nr:class II fructose-1,6-bisphosphate aldolase [Mycoplasmopsis opalescens]
MLVNAKKMVDDAYKNRYAVPHININNLEWAKNVLLACEEMRSPVILSASEGAVHYMGGYKTVSSMVNSLVKDLNITVPVALHLDHGTFEGCKKAIEEGFTSIMFDGSKLEFNQNYSNTAELVTLAKENNISIEAEVGQIGGQEDDIFSKGELANLNEAISLSKLGIDFLAAGVGNIHGKYPTNWKSLNFDLLDLISKNTKIGIVLHGGSGIPNDQIKKAIDLGVAKININTELQLAFHQAIRDFIVNNKDLKGKNYDPRLLLKNGCEAIKQATKEKILLFSSNNRY